MQSKVKRRRAQAGADVGAPGPLGDVATADAVSQGPAAADPGSVDRGPPCGGRDPGQTDIERANEHKVESIEHAARAQAASAAEGFVEPGSRDAAAT